MGSTFSYSPIHETKKRENLNFDLGLGVAYSGTHRIWNLYRFPSPLFPTFHHIESPKKKKTSLRSLGPGAADELDLVFIPDPAAIIGMRVYAVQCNIEKGSYLLLYCVYANCSQLSAQSVVILLFSTICCWEKNSHRNLRPGIRIWLTTKI